MARIGDQTVFIGSPDWYIGDPLVFVPRTEVTPEIAQFALNDTARLDGSSCVTDDPLGDALFFDWEIGTTPQRSARRLRVSDDRRVALITLDDVGPFFIRLRVSGANGGAGTERVAIIVAQPAIAPYELQQTYSTSWLWQYLPDVWSRLPITDRLRVETFWRGLQQLAASDVMQVLNAKDALSLATIQDAVFRKWLRVQLTLDVSGSAVLLQEDTQHNLTEKTGDTFLTLAQLSADSDISLRGELVTGATLLNGSSLLMNRVNAQPFDLSRSVQIEFGDRIYTARVSALTRIGDRVAAVLAPPVEGGDALPAPVRVTLRDTSSPALGIVQSGDRVAEIGYTSVPASFVFSGNIPSDATSVTRGAQVRIAHAYDRGIRAGDTLHYRVEDDLGNHVELVADVLAVSAGFVRVAPRDTLSEIIAAMLTRSDVDTRDDIAEAILAEVSSVAWRRRHFRAWITAGDTLDVGVGTSYARSVRLLPLTVTRRSVCELPDGVTSLFRLTERTERAALDGETLITEGLETVAAARPPVELFENLDFYVRAQRDSGRRLRSNGSRTLVSARFDFSKSGVTPGDVLTITSGPYRGNYIITGVNGEAVTVDRAVPSYGSVTFDVQGAATSRQLVFSTPLPEDITHLWAEIAVVDNAAQVSTQFGALAGLRLDDWVTRGLTNTYKDAVMGLYYARVTASTVAQIENAVSVISGIPFASRAARISEIDDAYELDDFGRPQITRVLLEELDANGVPTQRFSAHTFPTIGEDSNIEFSGIAINPSTGRRYEIGDTIQQFTALALGAKVTDLYTATINNGLDDVLDRHRFRITIDVDAAALRDAQSLRFVKDFVVEIKPAYVALTMMLSKFLADTITVEEDIFLKLRTAFYDNPYHHRGPANMLDDINPDRDRVDGAVLSPLTTWFPRDGSVVFSDSTAVITSITGGFVDPSRFLGESVVWPQPWLRIGDVVSLRERGLRLTVTQIVNDTTLALSGAIPAELRRTTLTQQRFFVGRQRTDVIRSANVQTISADDRLPLLIVGDTADDVGAGDIITLDSASVSSAPLRVLGVDRGGELGAKVFTYPTRPLSALTSTTLRVFREQIVDRVLYTGALVSTRRVNGRETFYRAQGVSLRALGVEPGDLLRTAGQPERLIACVTKHEIVAVPPVPRGTALGNVTIVRPSRTSQGDANDEHERAVGSCTEIMIKGLTASLCRSVIRVSFPLRPGDLLYFPSADFDHGEGKGITRVMAVLNNGRCAYGTGRAVIPTGPVTIIRQAPLRWMYYTPPEDVSRYSTWATQHWS